MAATIFGAGAIAGGASSFVATVPPIDDSIPDEQGGGGSVIDDSLPTIDPATQTTLPAGCIAPRAATATFLGELISTDDLLATYRVVQVRGGSLGDQRKNARINEVAVRSQSYNGIFKFRTRHV